MKKDEGISDWIIVLGAILLVVLIIFFILPIIEISSDNKDGYSEISYKNVKECERIIFEETGISNIRCDDFYAYNNLCDCSERFFCLEYASYGTTNQTCLNYNKEVGDLKSWRFDLVEVLK